MGALCFGPVGLVVFVIHRKRLLWRASSKVPFQELRRRPAGESLRLKLESLDERLYDWILLLMGFPAILMILGVLLRPRSLAFPALLFLLSLMWGVFFGRTLYDEIRDRANYQLGFDGERFVGEELTRLFAEGFEIYHDLPFDGFNIDHVLVGPSGVFAVETKTRRKPVHGSGERAYRVEFDGLRLHWPMGADDHAIDQSQTMPTRSRDG